MTKLKYRVADVTYPMAYKVWQWLPTRIKLFYFLNCDLIS